MKGTLVPSAEAGLILDADIYTLQKVFQTYTYSTAAWLSLQSLALLVSPSVIVAMLLDETRPASGTTTPTSQVLINE